MVKVNQLKVERRVVFFLCLFKNRGRRGEGLKIDYPKTTARSRGELLKSFVLINNY